MDRPTDKWMDSRSDRQTDGKMQHYATPLKENSNQYHLHSIVDMLGPDEH